MSEAELKLQKIRVILDALESSIREIRDVFKGTSANRPIFPEPYSEMLTISDQGDCWQIKPKVFLETGDFSEILRLVKAYNGIYVSAGKSSHFRVPK